MKKDFNTRLRQKIIKAVLELKNASYNDVDYIKLYANLNDKRNLIWYGIYSQNSYSLEDNLILSFKFTHPDYNSESYWVSEEESGMTLNEWDWMNFTESSDIHNYVDQLYQEALRNIEEIEYRIMENQ